jgi:hypothetical protein
MIARQETFSSRDEVWGALAAPVPAGTISWRQDGKPVVRDGRHFARFVCYIEANTVRERLDTVVPGEWDLMLEMLPQIHGSDDSDSACAFKARLQVLGVIREDVGTGRDYKQAATDAFKRAAVRFGIGNELYSYEQNWVEVDGDGRYAKPVEDPAAAYARRHGAAPGAEARPAISTDDSSPALHTHGEPNSLTDVDAVSCPKCGGRMWDNRLTKRNPKAPDYKCRDRSCDGVIWPERKTATDAADEIEAGDDAAPVSANDSDARAQARKKRKTASLALTDEIPF